MQGRRADIVPVMDRMFDNTFPTVVAGETDHCQKIVEALNVVKGVFGRNSKEMNKYLPIAKSKYPNIASLLASI